MDKVQFAIIPSKQNPVYIFAHDEMDALDRYARNRRFNNFEDAVIRGGWCGSNFTVYEVQKSNSGPPVPVQQEDPEEDEDGQDAFARYLEQKAEAATYHSGYWGENDY